MATATEMMVRDQAALNSLYQTPVFFEGFKASLGELYSKRWEIRTDRNVIQDSLHVYLVSPTLELAGEIRNERFLERSYQEPLIITRMSNGKHTQVNMVGELPQMARFEPSLADHVSTSDYMGRSLSLFELLRVEEPQEIFVDETEDCVADLLKRVSDMQRSKQRELREKARSSAVKKQASIISLIDYKTG